MRKSKIDDAEIASVVLKIVKQLKSSSLQVQLQRACEYEAEQHGVTMETLKNDVVRGLQKSGWMKILRNVVYREISKLADEDGAPPSFTSTLGNPERRNEPLAYMRKAQTSWERRIIKSVNSMCVELNIPLARKRRNDEQRDLLLKWNEMSTDESDVSHFRPVYAPKDFLEVVASLRNPNFECLVENVRKAEILPGLIQLPLQVLSTVELRQKFSELDPKLSQNGVDDEVDVITQSFSTERRQMARTVLDDKQSAVAQYFLRRGSPNDARADLWQLALGVTIDHLSVLHYEQLKGYVLQHDLFVDSLIFKDVKLTATNDDYYFVFEDYLYQVLLVFSRDASVLEHFKRSSAMPPISYINGKWGVKGSSVTYPPNGVVPFHGFSMYVTPLCYLYAEPTRLYFMFREMYTRYFFRLHTISSHPQCIVSLCVQFETTLQTAHPKLFFHLKDMGMQPLKIAFKWLVRAYSGYLAPAQLHLLWDRVIGHGDLRLLSVLAVAIFVFRQANLLTIAQPIAVEAAMADISTLNVVQLLQMFFLSG